MTTSIVSVPPTAVHDNHEVVLGVDTHKDMHVAAVTTTVGLVLDSAGFPATAVGYRQLLAWAREHGEVRRAGVEGTGSYGAALARFLRTKNVDVIEVNRPDRAMRRRHGKNDTVDAEAAAQAVVSRRATAVPKDGDGPVEDMRLYKLAKDSAVKARTQATNQLKAILVNADPALREALAGLGTLALITACSQLEEAKWPGSAAAVYTLRTLARRIHALAAEIRDLTNQLVTKVKTVAPALLDQYGVGPDSAATLLIAAGDNPGRLTSEGAFAALCGVSPVERSSGRTHRHRLNRGGDRQANAALWRIVLTRLRDEPRSRSYLQRRTTEGRSRRDVVRCLKRYVARDLFGIIRFAMSPPTAPTA
ncbi:IS110 family transposase [Streptomyces sp. YGL11-2]|uniref:IS110 family transposase n=1 Tax=Streptomyces sp. YGL11-2 TaxID=3414028 RepID=UPI003CF26E38